ncbi:MAG: GNAT family N-acetyltransferase [Acetobacteraceae bacterium]|nr:GNAT family N-acetyltransferase [Acetobacteraceae bacterium]
MQTAFTDAIRAAQDELAVEIVRSPEQLLQAQQLRFRVYCEERGFEPGVNGLEQDAFDAASRHVVLRSRESGLVLGTVRLVLSRGVSGLNGFPMQQACEPWVLSSLPIASMGEVSRFALTRDRAGISPSAAALMRLCLIRGLVQLSAESALSHWCAIMERTLLRLLRATGIHFIAVGPTVEYHGTRQPAVCGIDAMLSRMKLEQPVVWAYVTDNGALWAKTIAAQQTSAAVSRLSMSA